MNFRDHLVILSGLSHLECLPLLGEVGGEHARASSAFLTGVHAKKTGGADIRVAVSLDQIAARELGKYTQLASLEIGLDAETLGECENGFSCVYSGTLSWRSPTTPMSMESQPRAVFENLFGDSTSSDPKKRLAEIESDHSILDFVTERLTTLERKLGPTDRTKLSEYLDAIRDVERRIQIAEKQSSRELSSMDRPSGIPATFQEHAKLMYDLQVLAYQSDLTRVTTFMMGREQTGRAYPEIGISDSHHPLSHHGGDPVKMEKVARINVYHTQILAYFLERLKSTPDGDGTLLDHTAILYGSGMSDGNFHRPDNLPIMLVGGGGGKIKGGRHIRYQKDTPMTNLYGTLLDVVGVPLEDLGSSSGKLEPLSIN